MSLEAVLAIHEFDNEMQQIGEAVEEDMNSCKDLLFWLYLVNKNKIYSTLIIEYCNIHMQAHFKALEKVHLVQETTMQQNSNQAFTHQDIENPLEIIANSSSITWDFLDGLTQMQATSSGDKQKSHARN